MLSMPNVKHVKTNPFANSYVRLSGLGEKKNEWKILSRKNSTHCLYLSKLGVT